MHNLTTSSPDETFAYGESLASQLEAGDVILLYGGLGAGKTLLTKGIVAGLGYDVDEVTSPSFTLVNLYRAAKFDVYHIDLWRLDDSMDPAEAVGLDEILEQPNAIAIVEWADRLKRPIESKTMGIQIAGDGDGPRSIEVRTGEAAWLTKA
ncbi:MAG: tRNA (adenosine(37)-N6)-threonylcarbamoyltransferase complex ATPase subunit type 1 TsaE [Acidobacteria bacterium]|nr:tRNA (adenosine(37)-N6)-threonylcarbamoyltransferase complex ATPase subunit type 1 TsaE [Acidobacteriota bacterium]